MAARQHADSHAAEAIARTTAVHTAAHHGGLCYRPPMQQRRSTPTFTNMTGIATHAIGASRTTRILAYARTMTSTVPTHASPNEAVITAMVRDARSTAVAHASHATHAMNAPIADDQTNDAARPALGHERGHDHSQGRSASSSSDAAKRGRSDAAQSGHSHQREESTPRSSGGRADLQASGVAYLPSHSWPSPGMQRLQDVVPMGDGGCL